MLQSSIENQNKHFIYNIYIYIFFFENRASYEIMWKNAVEPGKPHDNMAHADYLLDIMITNTNHRNM